MAYATQANQTPLQQVFYLVFQTEQVMVAQQVLVTPLVMMHSAGCFPIGWMTSWIALPVPETSFLHLWPQADQVGHKKAFPFTSTCFFVFFPLMLLFLSHSSKPAFLPVLSFL